MRLSLCNLPIMPPIMPALCPMLLITYYASNYAGIIGLSLFADPVKQQRCTTGPVRPLDGINKDVCGAKLHPMAVFAYPVDCDCWCHLLDTHCCCMSPGGTNPTHLRINLRCEHQQKCEL